MGIVPCEDCSVGGLFRVGIVPWGDCSVSGFLHVGIFHVGTYVGVNISLCLFRVGYFSYGGSFMKPGSLAASF